MILVNLKSKNKKSIPTCGTYRSKRKVRIEMRVAMLSTVDNPYDPFEEFDKWYNYDTIHGYNSCSYLSKISNTSDVLPESFNQAEIERAIDEILEININGLYCKVVKDV